MQSDRLKIGMGFENGVAVVILAIILDRLTQSVGRSNKKWLTFHIFR